MAATAAVYNRLHNASFGNGIGAVGGGSVSGSSAGNALHSTLARSLERILEEAHLSGELNLANRKLKDFPKTGTKYNLADTVIADLSRNRFCELPEEITAFPFLEKLLLYHNTIRSIPESIKNLTSLTYLDLRSNQLPSLPREVCFLPLQVLLVSNNRLTALPDELGRMDRLTDLDASYNQLSALPARIGELRSLRSFSLRSNQLMYLPRELTCLTLVSLDVSNNRIASLPLEIRQMSNLVELNLENNPLTSPPASLCVRGLVHVFKYLETQAIKDEKGSRAGGNYDGYTTLRRAPRHNSSGNVLETHRIGRPHIDSGYSTCDSIDKRWSHDMPSVKNKNSDSPIRRMPVTPPNSLSAELMDASLTSSSSTIVDESISFTAAVVKPLNFETKSDLSPEKQHPDTLLSVQSQSPLPMLSSQSPTKSYAHSCSSNGSSPDNEDDLIIDNHQQNGKLSADEKSQKNLGNIQTYREYKEALKQQRNQEVNVYKSKGQQKTLYDMNDATNALNSNTSAMANNQQQQDDEVRINGINITNNIPLPKSIMKNTSTTNGHNGVNVNGNGAVNGLDEAHLISKKPVQKVIPSRNTELMSQAMKTINQNQENEKLNSPPHTNGDCLGYVKPNSPMKTANGSANTNGGILINNNKLTTNGSSGSKSPVNGSSLKLTTPKTHRTVTWNHDIPPEKLSFTMRREFDRQREETELMTQLRSIIETRLKMTLPEDIASALTDGVILCHLANYVRPRSVASIHVPSPGVSKLTMARCRRNVDNFLEACRKIGVDEELICSCADVVPAIDDNDRDHQPDDNNDDCNGFYSNTNGSYIIGTNNNNDNHFVDHDDDKKQMQKRKSHQIPNPEAVFQTVVALIEMDFNPHHQTAKYLYQQQIQQQQQQQQLQYQQKFKINYNGGNIQQSTFPIKEELDEDEQNDEDHFKYISQNGDGNIIQQKNHTFNNYHHDYQHQQHQKDYEQQNLNYNKENYNEDQQTATCTKQQILQQQQLQQQELQLELEHDQEQEHEQKQKGFNCDQKYGQDNNSLPLDQHHLVANYEFKASKTNIQAKCHFENVMSNGNNQTKIIYEHEFNGHSRKENLNYENIFIAGGKIKGASVAPTIAASSVVNEDFDEVDVVDSFDNLTKKLMKHNHIHNQKQNFDLDHQQEHEQNCANTILLRSANLKNFQNINYNLMSSHYGNNNSTNTANNNNNNFHQHHHSSLMPNKTLHTILETESDGENTIQRTSPDGRDYDNGYELINEKTKKASSELSLKISPKSCNDLMMAANINKYKLLEVSSLGNEQTGKNLDCLEQKREAQEKQAYSGSHKSPSSEALVSKRIEFFEHSTNGNNSSSCSTNGCNSLLSPTTKSSTPTNGLTPNGIVASAKSKVMNNIFSIYQVSNIPNEKILSNGKIQTAALAAITSNAATTVEKDLKDAGSSLLKHDSYGLTIILSCIFIGTFFLLIFFPLPG